MIDEHTARLLIDINIFFDKMIQHMQDINASLLAVIEIALKDKVI